MQTSKRTGDMPDIRALAPSPLRNRIRIHLDAPASEVWALLGDFARFPEYSSGLERVESKVDATGRHTEFTCHFKPLEPGGARIVSREIVRWWEPDRGYASSSAGGDAFGMTNDLNLVVIEPATGVIVTMLAPLRLVDADNEQPQDERLLAGSWPYSSSQLVTTAARPP